MDGKFFVVGRDKEIGLQHKATNVHLKAREDSGKVWAAHNIGTRMSCRKTVSKAVAMIGVGLHSGQRVALKVMSAQPLSGIRFIRVDLPGKPVIKPCVYLVETDALCTRLKSSFGESVATVEHLMAALWSMGIDDIDIEVSGAEIPAGDGSSKPFLDLLSLAGIKDSSVQRQTMRILKPVEVVNGRKWMRLEPSETFGIDCTIDFPDSVVGHSRLIWNGNPDLFRDDLSSARTFAFERDVNALRAAGMALGGSLANAVVVNQEGVLNPEGLRYSNEFVRHKILDIIGDLYLLGCPLVGKVTAHMPGHALTNALVRTLLDDEGAWRLDSSGNRESKGDFFAKNDKKLLLG